MDISDSDDSAFAGHIPLEHGLKDRTGHRKDQPVARVFFGGPRGTDNERDIGIFLVAVRLR